MSVDEGVAPLAGAQVERVAQHHRGRADQQRRARAPSPRSSGPTWSCPSRAAGRPRRRPSAPSPAPASRTSLRVDGALCAGGPWRRPGRITTAATRSLEIACEGVTPNSRISIGVISAPPPAPVMPTRKPTTALPSTMYGSMCMNARSSRVHPSRMSTRPPPALPPVSRAGEYSARSSHRRGEWSWGGIQRIERPAPSAHGGPDGLRDPRSRVRRPPGCGALAPRAARLPAAGSGRRPRGRLRTRMRRAGGRRVGADIPGLRWLAAVIMMRDARRDLTESRHFLG